VEQIFVESIEKHKKNKINLDIMFSGFPKEKKHIWANSRKDGLNHLEYSITYPTT
jgi:hypothetical protein